MNEQLIDGMIYKRPPACGRVGLRILYSSEDFFAWQRVKEQKAPHRGAFTPSKRATGRRPFGARGEFRALRSAT